MQKFVADRWGSSEPTALRPAVVPPSVITSEMLESLDELIGAQHVLSDDESRTAYALGFSTPDLLRRRAGDYSSAPDAVVRPGSPEDVLAVVRWASEHRVAAVPVGGGTSVVGGLASDRNRHAGVLGVDLGRLRRLVSLDHVSRTATLEPGLRGPEAEALLAAEGYTLGHFPQSFEFASIGGFAATRSSGQASCGFGRFDSMVVGLRVATPAGELRLGVAPRTAAGPDLRQLFLGSEGTLGIITEVTVDIRPVPEVRDYAGWRWSSFEHGVVAMRRVAQDGPRPTVLRLSDESESALSGDQGCTMVVGIEGSADEVADRKAKLEAVLHDLGGESLGRDPGERWLSSRFRGPYRRDALLDAGVLVDTVETATFWSRIPQLYDAVGQALRDALRDAAPIVNCHISHVYPSGCSLYFTVLAKASDAPVEQWLSAKAAASDAITAAGGTITHHHAVGRDHRPWLGAEVGELGLDILRAVKRQVDPGGVLNPGVLVE